MSFSLILQSLLSLVFVLALITICALVVRKLGLADKMASGKKKNRRLQLIEKLTIDNRLKLILVQKDDREYLVLSESERSTILENGAIAVQNEIDMKSQ